MITLLDLNNQTSVWAFRFPSADIDYVYIIRMGAGVDGCKLANLGLSLATHAPIAGPLCNVNEVERQEEFAQKYFNNSIGGSSVM